MSQGSHTLLIVHDPWGPSTVVLDSWSPGPQQAAGSLSNITSKLGNMETSSMSSCSCVTLMAVPSGFSGRDRGFSFLMWRPVGCRSPQSHVPLTGFTRVSTGEANSFPFLSLPVILKSTCRIDVRWFPFDVQKCDLKFGSWTFDRRTLDLQMVEADISSYTPSGEWDLMGKQDQPVVALHGL